MNQSSTSEKLICLLTTALYACFSIFNTSAWSSLSLLIVTAIILVLQIHRKGLNDICFTSFHSSVFLFGVFCLLSSLWALNSQEAIEKEPQ